MGHMWFLCYEGRLDTQYYNYGNRVVPSTATRVTEQIPITVTRVTD